MLKFIHHWIYQFNLFQMLNIESSEIISLWENVTYILASYSENRRNALKVSNFNLPEQSFIILRQLAVHYLTGKQTQCKWVMRYAPENKHISQKEKPSGYYNNFILDFVAAAHVLRTFKPLLRPFSMPTAAVPIAFLEELCQRARYKKLYDTRRTVPKYLLN